MSNHTDIGITCFLKNWFIVLSFEDQNNCYDYLQAKWVKNCDQVSHTGEKQTQATDLQTNSVFLGHQHFILHDY